MDGVFFEYFPNGHCGEVMFAPTWPDAIQEAHWRMEDDGSRWAGIIAASDSNGFLGSVQVVSFDSDSDHEDDDDTEE